MGTNMTPGYLAAMAASYANKEGGITIPAKKLDGIAEIPIGSQPLGIASRWAPGGNDIVFAAYFEPTIYAAYVSRDKKGLHFAVSQIREVKYGSDRVRLFPDVAVPGGANRAQTVNFGPDGTLWVTRNTGREFFVLGRRRAASGGWRLTNKVVLPGSGMVHSAHLALGTESVMIETIESSDDIKNWSCRRYSMNPPAVPDFLQSTSVPGYLYGGASNVGIDFAVTDCRASIPLGIYELHGGNYHLVVPDVWGNGICFLSDGSALVTRYGHAHKSAFGLPGCLVYVPARFFKS